VNRLLGVLLCSSALATTSAHAQTWTIELAGGAHANSSYPDGDMMSLRLRHDSPANVWYGAVTRESRFGDAGWTGSLANTHVFNEDWYSFVSVAAGRAAFFVPRYRLDAQLARKFGEARRWVGVLSAGSSAAQDEHRDAGAGIGLIHYLPMYVILEGAVYWNRSNPGHVIARRQLLAATWFRPRRHQLSARVSTGSEAYQLTGGEAVLIDFKSTDAVLSWQRWVSASLGFTTSLEYYTNPTYRRSGVTVSVFKQTR
jgi:YaiO family outer membrane protein